MGKNSGNTPSFTEEEIKAFKEDPLVRKMIDFLLWATMSGTEVHLNSSETLKRLIEINSILVSNALKAEENPLNPIILQQLSWQQREIVHILHKNGNRGFTPADIVHLSWEILRANGIYIQVNRLEEKGIIYSDSVICWGKNKLRKIYISPGVYLNGSNLNIS